MFEKRCAIFSREGVKKRISFHGRVQSTQTKMSLALSCITATAYTISIVGAQGRLGRELVAQSLQRGWNVEGIVRRPLDPILQPVKKGWLTPDVNERSEPISSPRLTLTSELDASEADGVVFCMSARPFAPRSEMSNQTNVVRAILKTCSHDTRICLVSAYGAGDSLNGSNAGIQFMHSVYLREAYAAKEEQEILVSRCNSSLILRPRVLSFSEIPLNPVAVPRFRLASNILDWCETFVPNPNATH